MPLTRRQLAAIHAQQQGNRNLRERQERNPYQSLENQYFKDADRGKKYLRRGAGIGTALGAAAGGAVGALDIPRGDRVANALALGTAGAALGFTAGVLGGAVGYNIRQATDKQRKEELDRIARLLNTSDRNRKRMWEKYKKSKNRKLPVVEIDRPRGNQFLSGINRFRR